MSIPDTRQLMRLCHATSAVVIIAVSAACSSASERSDWNGWTGIGSGIMPFVLFPQLPEPPVRTNTGDATSADPNAPVCPAVAPAESARAVVVRLPRSDLPSLEFRVPQGYEWQPYPNHEGFEQTGEYWGGMLGNVRRDTVIVRGPGSTETYPPDITFWLWPGAGYPTAGLPPGTVQTAVSECQFTLGSTTLRLVRYRTRSPEGEERESVAAYWEVAERVVLTAASGLATPEEIVRALAVIHSVRLVR